MHEEKENSIKAGLAYASVPLLRSAYRTYSGKAPWLACDPLFQGECSAAVRAVRLVLFALFAIFIAPLRSKRASAEKIETAQAMRTADEKCVGSFQQSELQNQSELAFEKLPTAMSISAKDVPHGAASDAKPQKVYLVVKRSHGPPLSSKTLTSIVLRSSAHLLPRTIAQIFPSNSPASDWRLNTPDNLSHLNLLSIAAARSWAQVFLVSHNLATNYPEGEHQHDSC